MLEPYLHHHPVIDPQAWVHAQAVIIGDVRLCAGVTVWPGSVLRGDQGSICVGAETSIQDGCILHATKGTSTTVVGARCVVGHRAVLHGCLVDDDCLIGMGAVLLDNCRIGRFCIVGAGAVVPAGRVIPPRSMVLGVPARVVRSVSDAEIETSIRHGHGEYMRLGAEYRARDADTR
ncbi:MAG: gamma carbonic anhydrase family protein [Oligoflexia bacterium]|nr:gamma carbonic anhydrase family protein [Oligoflexia bacterium]